MGNTCCEHRKEKVFFDKLERAAFTSSDIGKIEEIYRMAEFSLVKGPGYTYQEVLDRITPIVTSMDAANKLPLRLALDWENVKDILSKRSAENPKGKYSITRDLFIQLWQLADDSRSGFLFILT